MEVSFGLFFVLRKRKGENESEVPVYLRITVNGQAAEISIKRRCLPSSWNVRFGRLTAKGETAREFNAYLDTLERKVYECKRTIIDEGKELTAETIKNKLLGKDVNADQHMLMKIFQKHNEQIAALVGTDYAPGTLERYKTSYKHTLSFLESRYRITDIDIKKLDYEFLSEYEFWLKSVRKCDHNTSIKYLSNFRKIVNRCVRNGWLIRDPFLGYSMAKREVERTALTEDELRAITAKQFTARRLELVRDIFLFSCFTGLAYADVKKLKLSEIVIGNDGERWIICKRTKTDITSRIPLLPMAARIIAKYKESPERLLDGTLLPVLSNQKMNSYLKEIADVAGLSKELTFHIARHTFATTITLSNGVPIETVSKMLGHRNLKTTQHYAKILDNKISKDMSHLHFKYQAF